MFRFDGAPCCPNCMMLDEEMQEHPKFPNIFFCKWCGAKFELKLIEVKKFELKLIEVKND